MFFSLSDKEKTEHIVKLPITIYRFLNFHHINVIHEFLEEMLTLKNIYHFNFKKINPSIVENVQELHHLFKESAILDECLIGKFSFLMFEETYFFYKVKFFNKGKNEKNGSSAKMKVIVGVQQKVMKIQQDFLDYFIKIIIINLFEVLCFKETKYSLNPSNIIMEIESDNSDNKICEE